ncbi:MAG: hypothetical protein GXO57_07705 [Thermodesulfobacteria bacterium]|nr:hypothetical protein [Thermodesulfobacteriota bacterium]
MGEEDKEEKNKEGKEEEELVLCMKYQEYQRIEEGCKHPKEYCPYRQTCPIQLFGKDF